MDQSISLTVNGIQRSVEAEPDTSLLEILRDDLGLTGTKYGCGESQCGACTVLIDGEATHSCITPVGEVVGKKVETIESLETSGRLTALQQAFLDEGAMQCAYCVSGMIVAATGMLRKIPHPTDEEILGHMRGNICRCGSYPRMLAAIKKASTATGGGK